MTQDTQTTAEAEVKEPGLGKRLYLAGLGGGIVLREAGSSLFSYLVARGASAEEPTRVRASALRDKARDELRLTGEALGRSAQKIFGRFSEPRREDLSDLASQIDNLGQRIDDLEP